jgi:uncharacterized membrane protein HdeD (DUF308 family)
MSSLDTTSAPLRREELALPHWWSPVLRGLFAIAFGVLTFVWPALSLLVLVWAFGIYALADGFGSLGWSIARARRNEGWGWIALEGVISLIAGLLAILWPGITAFVLLIVIAVWALALGITEIATALTHGKHVSAAVSLAIAGVVSCLLGVLLLARPGVGALAVVWWIGAAAIIEGVLRIMAGFRLRRFERARPHLLREQPA